MGCYSALKWYNKSIMYFNSQPQQRKARKTAIYNIEILTLQVDGPITGRAYIRTGLQPESFFLFAGWWAYNRRGL